MERLFTLLTMLTGALAASMLIGPCLDANAVAETETLQQDRRPASNHDAERLV